MHILYVLEILRVITSPSTLWGTYTFQGDSCMHPFWEIDQKSVSDHRIWKQSPNDESTIENEKVAEQLFWIYYYYNAKYGITNQICTYNVIQTVHGGCKEIASMLGFFLFSLWAIPPHQSCCNCCTSTNNAICIAKGTESHTWGSYLFKLVQIG